MSCCVSDIISTMKILSESEISKSSDCPYLKGMPYKQEYFCAYGVDSSEFQTLLDQRWRRFGIVFFRPVCPDCMKCIPIRVDVSRFKPSSSQRRVLKKNRETTVLFSELTYREDLFAVYEKHSRIKFDQTVTEEEFFRNFFQPAVPSFQSEFYVDEKLIGFGILDESGSGLSTVYFSYDPDYSSLSPGTYSILESGLLKRVLNQTV
ncbi:MAG: hypothetical protein B6241_00060 [Spirochaetaceae bacterium 4572_59]|nr:MAG: hypothetical protein B6241_00060 [Spirochaetaceae bacterium 4572_59]